MNEIRLEHDSLTGGGGRAQETTGQKMRPNFETPDNANKQGKDLKALFCC